MKIKPMDLVICRTPAFSINAKIEDVWDELKEKIKNASPSFYEIIASKNSSQFNELNEKTQFTLWKYFNRAKYRATPFNAFAAITPINIGNGEEELRIKKPLKQHQFTDWKYKDNHILNSKSLLKSSQYLYVNSTLYEIENELRYIWLKDGEFQLSSVISFPEMKLILDLCANKIKVNDIYEPLHLNFQINKSSINYLISQLIDLQLLFTEQQPNITGEDYFTRTKVLQKNTSPSTYIIAERKLMAGNFDQKKLKNIPSLINFLAQCMPDEENANLASFKNSFSRKFEHQEIPLAIAMDPEIGIGYGQLEQQNNTDELVTTLKNGAKKTALKIDYSDFHVFLLNKILAGKTIHLDEYQAQLNETQLYILPNTFSVLFHTYQNQPVIENAGGCTANSLLGRFTLAIKELENYGKQIAEIEGKANDDVIFFDMAYQAEKEIDNVNRRAKLYNDELPFLTWSTVENPLNFNDIMVSVAGSEIVLRSKKYNKRVIPRLCTAYNYTRSDLAAYRFLCDLQHQNLKTKLSFTLQEYFPKLHHYPRLVFKDIILSPAKWLIPKEHYLKQNNYHQLKTWLNHQNINFLIKIGFTDQTLIFDTTDEQQLKFLFSYCKQQKDNNIYITEALIDEQDLIKDENGEKYSPQYITNYYHEQRCFKPINNTEKQNKNNHIKMPGSEWLYIELYTNTNRSNDLLLTAVKNVLEQKRAYFTEWFFIRYEDPKAHIRLRFKLLEPSFAYHIIKALKTYTEPRIYNGLITDFNIKTYFREVDRYGSNCMELVEYFFYIDSKQALLTLAKTKHTDQLYASVLFFINDLFSNVFLEIDEQVIFAKKIAESFADEHEIDPPNFKKINEAFYKIKDSLTELAIKPNAPLRKIQLKTFNRIFEGIKTKAEHYKMLTDLIHMHVNRLFNTNQRVHETIIYHYLLRHLQIKRAQNVKVVNN